MPDCLIGADAAPDAIPVHALSPDTLDAFLDGEGAGIADFVKAAGFKAAAGSMLAAPAEAGVGCVLFGLGKDDDRPPLLPGRLASALPAGDYSFGLGFSGNGLATLAFALGAYRYTRYRDRDPGARLVIPNGADSRRTIRIADAVYLTRDLINAPANAMGPAELALAAEDLAARHGATVTVTTGDALADGFPLIHVVGAAATPSRAPRLIDLTWGDPGDPKVTLVGKGVCFDTGGLDIKPSASMLLMKKDMGGAANVLGLAHMIMDAKLKVRLRVLIPAVENAIAGAAFRPGDIFRSRKGLTVEIGNTDAEGRLVLADALALAAEEEPAVLIDMATLTGAARVALGPEVVPVYTPDDALAADVARHAAAVADPVWRMPLWQPYLSMLDSKIADINNAGSGTIRRVDHRGAVPVALRARRAILAPRRHLRLEPEGRARPPRGRRGAGDPRPLRALRGALRRLKIGTGPA